MATTNQIEDKTSDYAETLANSGKIWADTNEANPVVKAVVEYTDGGNPAYAVKTFTLT